MKRRRFLELSALGTAAMLAACGSPSQSPTATSAPAAPATAPVQDVAAVKPVFIDFYAPW